MQYPLLFQRNPPLKQIAISLPIQYNLIKSTLYYSFQHKLLQILLREGMVGSDAFKQAVDRQLTYFEDELQRDLIRLAQANGTGLHEPALTAKANSALTIYWSLL